MTAALKTPVEAIRALTGAEAKRVAETEYRQLVELITTFGVEDWKRSTDCPGWDVDTMLRHLLGAMQANASIRENVHQLRAGNRWAKQHSASVTDGSPRSKSLSGRLLHLTDPARRSPTTGHARCTAGLGCLARSVAWFESLQKHRPAKSAGRWVSCSM